MREALVALATLALFSLFGCSSRQHLAHLDSPPLSKSLPSIGGLDGITPPDSSTADLSGELSRNTSMVYSKNLHPGQPLLSQSAGPYGSEMLFWPSSGIAWAIYRFKPTGSLLCIEAVGNADPAGLWLLVADYSTGVWGSLTSLKPGSVLIPFSNVGNPLSPAGYVYVAAVNGPAPNMSASSLSGLTLYYDAPPPGPVYYVAMPSDGADDGNDGSSDNPWATLQHAADMIQANGTVVVRPGLYDGFQLQTSGLPGQPISFKGEFGAEIRITNLSTPDGISLENSGAGGGIHDVVLENLKVTQANQAGIRIAGSASDPAHDIVVRGCECLYCETWGIDCNNVDGLLIDGNSCRGWQQHGIYLTNCDDIVVRRNHCSEINQCGIYVVADSSAGGNGTIHNAQIEFNVCYSNGLGGGAAIHLDGVADSVIRGNFAFDNFAEGLVIDNFSGQGSMNNVIVNNTILEPAEGDWAVRIGSSPGNQLYNNIFLSEHPTHGALNIADPLGMTGLVSDYNIILSRYSPGDSSIIGLTAWRSLTGQDLHSEVHTLEELYLDPADGDYRLKTDSPAINFGWNGAPELPPVDLHGFTRPQGNAIDAGAYEHLE